MWSLDPGIRDFVSEAREYAYDWNTPGGVPGLGPLLPSDDVKAMLARLFRDPADAKAPPGEHPEESIDESNPALADATPPVEAALEDEPVPDEAMRPATAAIPRRHNPKWYEFRRWNRACGDMEARYRSNSDKI